MKPIMLLSDANRATLVSTVLPLLLVGFVCFFSFSHLTESPPVWYDEGTYSQVAENSALYGVNAFQIAPHTFVSAWSVNGGFPFLAPITLSYKLFGAGVLQGRVVMAVCTILFTIVSYLFVRRMFGPLSALCALLLLATFPVLYGTGKNILGEVPGLLYLMLFLFAVHHLEKKQFRDSWWTFFVTGILLGLCVVTKPLFLVLLGAVGLTGLIHRRTIPWKRSWVIFGLMGLALPLGFHVVTHLLGAPAEALASYYANPYAKTSILATMAHNALRFFTEVSPLYCALIFGVWALSVVLRFFTRKTISLAEQMAFYFSVLVLLFYLRTEGWYRYFFTANVIALLFLPRAVTELTAFLRVQSPTMQRMLRYAPCIAIIILTSLQTYQLFFTSWVAVHNASTTTATMEKEFATLPITATIFFLNTPEIVIFDKGNPYYQYMTPAPGLRIGEETLAVIEAQIPDIIVVKQDEQEKYASYLKPYTLKTLVGDYALYERHL